MKKLIYILIGIFTFSVGFWLFHLRPLVMPVSLCEISQHAELYESKQIRIKAYLDGVGINDDDFYSVFDIKEGCLTGAGLDISDKLKQQLANDASLSVFVNELRQRNSKIRADRNKAGYYVAEVEITGEIKKVVETSCGITMSCFANTTPPFIVKTNEMKQISPIRIMTYEEVQKFRSPE